MPLESKAQWRKVFALEARGQLPRGTARQMAHETPGGFHSLPEYSASSGDLLPGGLGDKLTAADVDAAQLRAGVRVELEHTWDPQIAREIALDHLAELPDYYTRLDRMERAAKGEHMQHMQPMTGTYQPKIPYRIVQMPNGDWLGMATIQTAGGPVTVRATASPNAEARAIIARMRSAGASAGFLGGLLKGATSLLGGGASKLLGGGLGSIFKGAKGLLGNISNVAKKVAQGKILSALKESAKPIFQNPLIRQAAGIVTTPFLGPAGAMLVPQGLKAAGAIMFRARAKRDPRARRVVQRTAQLARRGYPRAKRLAQYFVQGNRVLNKFGPAYFARQPTNYYQKFQRPRYVRRYIRGRGWQTVRVAGNGENGDWMAVAGNEVFVPAAYSGSLLAQLVNELRPRLGYRGEAEALTLREAYRSGLSASPR